jgi:hypothetical protein
MQTSPICGLKIGFADIAGSKRLAGEYKAKIRDFLPSIRL